MGKKLLHTPEGVRDIYGKEFQKKINIEDKLRKVIHSYGYEDIQTPSFEYFDVFSREIGTTSSRDLYKFFDKEGATLVLRPDFTPSIARCAAKYFMNNNNPIRLCYHGNTFTNTSNLQGKLKEVTQMGAELINDDSEKADAEMISIVIMSLLNAGLKNIQITIGQIEYFKGLCDEAGLDLETEYALRKYISGKNYFAAEELLSEKKIDESYKKILLKVADLFGNIDSLDIAKSLVTNERSMNAIHRLKNIYEVLRLYGMEEYVSFDLGLLSKYNYYTGVIFKAYTFGIGDAIVKGGRYNHLLQQFGKESPAIGFMVVVDSLVEALNRQKISIDHEALIEKIYYTEETYVEKLKETLEARKNGSNVALLPEEVK